MLFLLFAKVLCFFFACPVWHCKNQNYCLKAKENAQSALKMKLYGMYGIVHYNAAQVAGARLSVRDRPSASKQCATSKLLPVWK